MMYSHDLFISYAHDDNTPLLEGQHPWVDYLHQYLLARLPQLSGRKQINIWRDGQLRSNEDFASSIAGQLQQTAALVMVLTPLYINSAWCKREVTTFYDCCNQSGGLTVDNLTRIFKISKTRVKRDQAPPELQPIIEKVTGQELYDVDKQADRFYELEPLSHEFSARLDKFAQDIVELLNKLNKPDKVVANSSKPAIYLAETTYDLHQQKLDLRRDLEQRGYRVLPDDDLPLEATQLNSFVTGQLAQAALSVHLVGARYGLIPEGSSESIVETQISLARKQGEQGKLERLVWLADLPGQTVELRNSEFIKALRSDGGWNQHADLLQTPLETLKTEIDDRLAEIEKPAKPAISTPVAADAEPAHVYLICDPQDQQAAQPLFDFLFDQNLEVTFPLFPTDEPDAAKRLADHQANLKTCDAAVVFFGAAGEAFLRQSLRDLATVAQERKLPFRSKAVCVAHATNFRTREALLVDQCAGFKQDSWTPFLSALKAAV